MLITGANTGVGRATALELAKRGDTVFLACRNRQKGLTAANEIREVSQAHLELVELDLSALRSIRRAAEMLRGVRFDALINNAAVAGVRGQTVDGYEMAYGTNYVGHYALTRLLLPNLVDGGRIVHLGSGSYGSVREIDRRRVRVATASWTGISEYATSKLAQMLFHLALSERFARGRRGLSSLVADPGNVASDAYRQLPWGVRQLWTLGMKSTREGAQTSVHCVASDAVCNGAAYVDSKPFAVRSHATDVNASERLWGETARELEMEAEPGDL